MTAGEDTSGQGCPSQTPAFANDGGGGKCGLCGDVEPVVFCNGCIVAAEKDVFERGRIEGAARGYQNAVDDICTDLGSLLIGADYAVYIRNKFGAKP